MDKTTLADQTVKSALDGYVKVKFQAEDPDAEPARSVMARFKAVGLPTYVILKPARLAPPPPSPRSAQAHESPGRYASRRPPFYSCGMPSRADDEAPAQGLLQPGGRTGGRLLRWLKPVVSVSLYALIFRYSDVGAILGRLSAARLEFVAAGVLLYVAGQALSAWRWRMLLEPVALSVPYRRMVSFYFIGMFFNLFLPTIIGGDAVKALLLARETGQPARATISVFMERNLGLLALLLIADGRGVVGAARDAVPSSADRRSRCCLSAAFIGVNIVLMRPAIYGAVDRIIVSTPLRRLRGRASSIYAAITPYWAAHRVLVNAFALSLAFQAIVIGVVFLNARALRYDLPFLAVAVFVPLISLGGMLPVSVNGLGVREALYILLFGRIGVSTELAVSLALLYLAVTFVASLPGGLMYALQPAPERVLAAQRAASDVR